MAAYNVLIDKDVERDIQKIPKQFVKLIMAKVLSLEHQPRPIQSLKLEGAEGVRRLRVGNYRVIYRIDDARREVVVYHIRDRKDAYRGL